MRIVDAGMRKELDLRVEMPVESEAEAAPAAYAPGANDGGSHSLWPALYPELLELVHAHHSTIVFVNSRRMAERLALRLNELSDEPVARAHHGSLSREARTEVEEALKAGTLPCIVATSSLELGIDMGAVDLVVQVSSPGSVASGLQRVGRAGHSVGAPSRGRIYPRFRGELVEAAAVARGMLEGEVEHTRVPRIPLDVLCQQIVAMSSVEELQIDELHALVRRAYPYRELTREQLENVLDLLAGRYPSDEFAELRPRIVWERTTGVAARPRGRPADRDRERRDDPRPRASTASSWSTAAAASASSTRRWCTRRARGRSSCWAPRPGGSSRSSATACSSPPRPASPPRCRSGRASRPVAPSSWAAPSAACSASSPRSTTRARSRG